MVQAGLMPVLLSLCHPYERLFLSTFEVFLILLLVNAAFGFQGLCQVGHDVRCTQLPGHGLDCAHQLVSVTCTAQSAQCLLRVCQVCDHHIQTLQLLLDELAVEADVTASIPGAWHAKTQSKRAAPKFDTHVSDVSLCPD